MFGVLGYKLFQPINMQGSKVSPIRRPELSQLNPQFSGIGKKLNRSHIAKNRSQEDHKAKFNRVSFLIKEEDQAQKLVQKKQKELGNLMAVITRRQAESIEREERRLAKEEAMARQRQQNLRRRSEHQDKIRNAFLSLYDEHQDNASLMKQTSRRYEDMRRSFRKETLHQRSDRVSRVAREKEEGRERINSYLKGKADMFTSRYKQQIRQEEGEAQRLSSQTRQMSEQEQAMKLRLQSSNSRIEALNEQIAQATLESRVLPVSNSWNWSALSKNYRTLDTKQQSSVNPDSKLQRQIERELSIEEEGQ